MIEQKKEDDQINQILQEDLIKANEFVTKTLQEKEAKPVEQNHITVESEEEAEEFLTDSEEEKVKRNNVRGRGFLKAKRKLTQKFP